MAFKHRATYVAPCTYVTLTSVLIAVVSDVLLKLVLSSRVLKIAGDFLNKLIDESKTALKAQVHI